MIRAIIFDYFRVITVNSSLEVLRKFDSERKYAKEMEALLLEHDRGKTLTWLFNKMADCYGVPVCELEEAYKNKPEHEYNNKLIDFIASELKNKYKVSLLSNVGPDQVCDMAHLSIFDDKVLSCEVDLVKPEPEIYILAAKRLGIKPEECIFVDDNTENVEAAKKVGMNGIIYSDFQNFMVEINELLKQNYAM